MSHGKFTRLAVLLDLSKPLCVQFTIHVKVQRVEYECLPEICFQYGKYGHCSAGCLDRVPNAPQTKAGGSTVLVASSDGCTRRAAGEPSEKMEFGPSMQVPQKETISYKRDKGTTSQPTKVNFGVLSNDNDGNLNFNFGVQKDVNQRVRRSMPSAEEGLGTKVWKDAGSNIGVGWSVGQTGRRVGPKNQTKVE
ncbi:OLC1v1022621C1 [Oldenlandia corymbosa var. corymbosa]|uniref:OLC1v1022621C1 n=1 Tax=Oldenlandia corymbosa var. corymbosa TaxID=529605 RepID=A0AAV1C127_OLDCO|nr:OLC1v1022621C1 [Oldenlandia corymbosa var. corymbosa]